VRASGGASGGGRAGGSDVWAGGCGVRAGGGDERACGYGVWHVLSVKRSGVRVDRVWLTHDG
jgi:hypothetical protein